MLDGAEAHLTWLDPRHKTTPMCASYAGQARGHVLWCPSEGSLAKSGDKAERPLEAAAASSDQGLGLVAPLDPAAIWAQARGTADLDNL